MNIVINKAFREALVKVCVCLRAYMMNRNETILNDESIAQIAEVTIPEVNAVLLWLTEKKMISYYHSRGVRVIKPLPAFKYDAEITKRRYKEYLTPEAYKILCRKVEEFDTLLELTITEFRF